MNPIGENYKVWVMHQAASRWLRKDISSYMRKQIRELETIEQDELIENVEKASVEVEKAFLQLLKDTMDIPAFDWEIN